MLDEQYYEFDCGCKFKVLDSKVNKDGFPTMEYDFYNLRNCQKVWDLLATGNTKGVFQLESQLGQTWCEKFKPNSIDEIAILSSILRPGSLEAMVDGKSVTQHFVDRKHGLEECTPMHPALGNILEETYNLGCFQEQSIQIVKEIAGFDEGTSEIFRKAVGKKQADKMAEMKPKFIQGCVDKGLTEKDGEDIFSILEASERYGFNRSHATIYSYLTYATAYIKIHFPSLFFTSWLHDSKEKIDPTEERKELIADAKRFDIQICNPTLNYISKGFGSEFFNIKDKVFFGLVDIKGIGYSQIKVLEKVIKESEEKTGKDIEKWSWFEFLCLAGSQLSKTVVNNLILVGAVPGIETRKRMLLEYKVWEKLNDKETSWIISNHTINNSLSKSLKEYLKVDKKDGGPYNSASVKKIQGLIDTIEKVSYNTNDDSAWISANETHLMGVSLSSHMLDDYDSFGDVTCKEMYDGKDSGTVCAQITSVRETVTKNGKNPGQKMCFIKLEDKTDAIDGVCFPNVFLKSQDIIYVGSVVLASVKRGQGKGVVVNSLLKA